MPNVRLCLESFAISFSNQHFGQMTGEEDSQCIMYVDMGATHSTIHTVVCGNLPTENGSRAKQFILVDSFSTDTVCGLKVDEIVHGLLKEKVKELVKNESVQDELNETGVTVEEVISDICLFNNRKEIESMKGAFSNPAVDETYCELTYGDFVCQRGN